MDIDKLSKYISKFKITTAIRPPSLIQHLRKDSFSSLVSLVSAGEECTLELANTMWHLVPHFINAYGPTEASIGATTYEIHGASDGIVPIGKALPGFKSITLQVSLLSEVV